MTAITRKAGTSSHASLVAEAGLGQGLPLAVGPAVTPLVGGSAGWANASGGDWGVAGNWSPSGVPSSSVDATIALAGAYTVTITAPEAAHSLSVTDAGAVVSDTSTLSIGTTLSLAAGVFQLGNGGEVSGGTISVASGADFQWDGGSLGVAAIHGAVNVNSSNTSVYIGGGTTFAGAGGSGLGTINFSGGDNQNSYLYAQGNFTLNNAALDLGSDNNNRSTNYLYNQDTGSGTAVLTLGSSFTINQTNVSAGIGSSDAAGDAIVNNGTINLNYDQGLFTIDAAHFSNSGSIDVTNGDLLVLNGAVSSSLISSITTGNGGFVSINGAVTGGTLTSASGDVGVAGRYDNVGPDSGTLAGVAVQGVLSLDDGGNSSYGDNGNATLTLTGATTFSGVGGSGSGTINWVGGGNYDGTGSNYINVVGNYTLNNVVVNIGTGQSGIDNSLINDDGAGTGATLTIGSGATVNHSGLVAGIVSSDHASDAIINNGTINLSYGQGLFSIDATDFTNHGAINVTNGDLLVLNGPISSALIDSITTGTGGFISINGSVTGGTLTSASGNVGVAGRYDNVGPDSGTLAGVAVQGILSLADGGYSSYGDNGNATLTLTGATSFSGVGGSGSGTINWVGGANADGTGSNYINAVGNYTLNDVVLNIGTSQTGIENSLNNDDSAGTGATLTIGSSAIINHSGLVAGIASSDHASDAIINNGTINLSYSQGLFTIDATSFTNHGAINVTNNDLLVLDGPISSALIDSITTGTGGFISINGSVTGGTLTSASGNVGVAGRYDNVGPDSGTLAGVAVQGILSLADGGYSSYGDNGNATLTLTGATSFSGVGGSGSGTINWVGGANADGTGSNYINAVGNYTLNDVVLNIGTSQTGIENSLNNDDSAGTGATLTIGSSAIINHSGLVAGIASSDHASDAIINNGTINLSYSQGLFTIDATSFTNHGAINVTNNDLLVLDGPISSALIDSITTGTGGFISINGSVTGGTLTSASGNVGVAGRYDNVGPDSGTLAGVAVQGILSLADGGYSSYGDNGNATLTLTGATSFSGVGGSGSGTISWVGGANADGTGSNYINVVGNYTLNNVVLNIGTSQTGIENSLNNIDPNGNGTTLTLGTAFAMYAVGEAALSDSGAPKDIIVNDGTVSSVGGNLTISPASFTNTGTLSASSGGAISIVNNFTNLSGTTLTGGTYIANANSAISLSSSATIATDAANIILNGAGSNIQNLDTTLSKIATTGTLTLQNGRNFAATANNGGFVDNGRLALSAGTLTATSLTTAAGASVFGNGTITAAINNAGVIEANGGYLLLQGAVTGAGTLQIDAGSTLEIGAAPATATTVFNGTGAKLIIDTPAQYKSVIQNFVGSDVIDLATTTLTSVSTSGTALLAVSASGTTTLTLAAPLANLHLALGNDGNGGTDITAYNLAQPAAHTPEPVKLGNVHVGATDSAFVTLTNAAPANGFSEKLDAALAGATGSATAGGTISKLAAGASNSTTLAIGLVTTAAGTLSGAATLSLASDGNGVDSFATTALASQVVNVTGAVYAFAKGTLANAGTLTLANTHAGHATSGFVTLTNAAATGGYAESLDAAFTGASTGITTSGTLMGLAAGAQTTNALQLGFSPANVGTYTGTATLGLTSDGAGIDGLGTTALASQTITVKGAAYAYAVGQVASGGTLVLANTHVGHTVTGNVTLANGAAANGFSEALDASVTANTAGLSAAGTVAMLAAGASNMTGLSVSANEAASGAYRGTATLALVSDGTGIDGLGTTALANQTLTITGNAYAYAVGQVASQTINLGVVHVGAAAAQTVTLTNAAAAGVYSEALDASWGTPSAGVSVSGSVSLLAAGAHSGSLAIGLSTSSSGSFSGSAALALLSDGSGIDGLGTTSLAGQTITVAGIVDNYALAAFADGSGPAITGSGTSFAVNLGSVVQGSAASTLALGVQNTASGLADLLQGAISASGTAGFVNSGFGSFAGLGAGQSEASQGVTLTTGTAGVFTETVLLSSAGTNASGYDGQLATETLTITGTVVSAGASNSYTLASGPNTILGAAGGDLFVTTSGGLNSLDRLTGGSGSNTLQMMGGGVFDLGAPKTFANILTLLATEAQTPKAGTPDPRQTVVMRDGQSETLTVQAGTPLNGNGTPETITIYDGADNDVFNLASHVDTLYLGTGSDTVTLGGTANSVIAGGGTALINATSATAAASIVGTTTGSTVLNLSNGGTVTLNAADTYLTVQLNAATHLKLGALGYITVNAGNGGDTIFAGGANQTLIGGTSDVLTGAVAGTDTFLGTSAALNGDTLGNWTTGDVIDLTDMNAAALQPLGFAASGSKYKLTVKDGTHSSAIFVTGTGNGLTVGNFTVLGSDGTGGTLIGWHAG